MTPRTRQKAVEMLRDGNRLTKYDLALAAPCDPTTARRALSALHADKEAHVVAWAPIYRRRIPVYAWGQGKDTPKPKAVPAKIRMRNRRKNDPELCIDEAMRKRAKRFLEKTQNG